MDKKTFNIINCGCRATQADGASLGQAFLDCGLGRAGSWNHSDVVIINTCTVTKNADMEARQIIRRVHRENPMARIIVTGCYAQRAPEEIAKIEGVSCVVGNSHKEQLVSIVIKKITTHPDPPIAQDTQCDKDSAAIFCSSIFESRELRVIANPSSGGRTRPVLKVQDGCSYRCSYCVIPYVRGNSRSLPEAEVIHQVRVLLDQGFKEITLTGIHLGGYGSDFGEKRSLAQVVRRLLKEERLERLRLSSIEPLEFTDELINLVAESPKMAKHFHVPLQSGSDRILRLMRRPYTAKYYAGLVEKMRQRVPEAAIGADVMVGFPTETDADHANTNAMLEDAPMTYLHVFPYSQRPGTPSENWKPEVRSDVAQQRSLELRELAAWKNLRFRNSFVGKNISVITLGQELKSRIGEALSSNYLKVGISGGNVRPNEILDVMVDGLSSAGLTAHRAGEEPLFATRV